MSHKKSSSLSLGNKKVPQEKLWNPESVVGWEDNTTHGLGASGNGGTTSSSGSCSRVDDAQQIDEERAALLQAKQSELDMIEDQHDNLVRVDLLVVQYPLYVGVATPDMYLSSPYDLCRYARRFTWNGGRPWLHMTPP
jgi:hypothetical protein